MIAIEYDPILLEQATFLAARRDQRLERDLHLAIDPLYELADNEARQRAFQAVFREFFATFGLNRLIADLIAEMPLVGEQVGRCVVREASRVKDESAELFVQDTDAQATPSQRTLVIQACPQSVLDSDEFAWRMRRELRHVADMLDDRFGYVREAIAGLPARQNLVRDRYGVLWDIYIEGRLDREGRSNAQTAQSLRRACDRVFAGRDAVSCDHLFSQVFDAPELTHHQLLDWARQPGLLFEEGAEPLSPGAPSLPGVGDGRKERDRVESTSVPHPRRGRGTRAGEPCPLCRFPTHDWFEFGADADGSLARTIQLDHAGWSTESGACRQCAEIYTAVLDRQT